MKVLDRKKNPPIVDAVNFKLNLKPYQKFVLDNGVEVYAVDAGAEEVLQTEWIYYVMEPAPRRRFRLMNNLIITALI